MLKIICPALLLTVICGCVSMKSAKHEQPCDASLGINIPYEKYILDNGLTVILSQDHSTPFVAVSLWYHVGSLNENKGKTGLAHLFEHLMFEGSKHVSASQHWQLLQKAGVTDVNASTSFDHTNYYETLPKSYLELALSLESSRMFFLQLTQGKLDEQRAVVRREREQRYETTPYSEATLKLWQEIFPKNNPFHEQVIGSHKDLSQAKLADVQKFYDDFYGPSNATLVLVGDFAKEEAKKLINRYFSSLPESQSKLAPSLSPVKLHGEDVLKVDEKLGTIPLVRIQYITPALFKKGDAELDILSHVLAGGEFGRLNQALTRKQSLASSVSAYQQSMEQISLFTIDALVNLDKSEESVITVVDEVLAGLVTNPPTEEEIERARNAILTNQFFGLQKLGGYGGRAELLQSYDRYAGNPGYIRCDISRYYRVKPKDLVETAKRYLPAKDRRKVLIAKPSSNQIASKGL